MNSPYISFCLRTFASIAILSILLVPQTGCKKQLVLSAPPTSTSSDIVFASDATATTVMTGLYIKIAQGNLNTLSPSMGTMYYYPSLSSDELTVFNPANQPNGAAFVPYFQNDLFSAMNSHFWMSIYPQIYVTNSAIEGLAKSTTLTPAVKTQLMGEAKFMRAFFYFYLVNFYGDIPMPLTTDYTVNALLSRTPSAKVWQQIVSDLKDAQNLLSSSFLDGKVSATTTERVRPTKWAATALLARAYLYLGDYADAAAQATAVIDNSAQFSLSGIGNLFQKNSSETIWAIQPVGTGSQSNTGEGAQFILPSTGPSGFIYYVYLSNNIVNSFEPNDLRRTNWVDSVIVGSTCYYYPYKYRIGTVVTAAGEYEIVLRLTEQYLIRAEAMAQQNKIPEAAADLNVIRSRAGLPNTTAATQSAMLAAILQERKVELFTEWGHRWLDLKRTNTVDSVMSVVAPQKGGTWQPIQKYYPIPQSELNADPNLVQTPGY